MPSDPPSIGKSDVVRALQHAEFTEAASPFSLDEISIERVSNGVNDIFMVSSKCTNKQRLVVKFGTYSTSDHLRAGVAAYRLLASFTNLPVPEVYAVGFSETELPPYFVMEFLPGENLTGNFLEIQHLTNFDGIRILGEVLNTFRQIPNDAIDGFGFIQRLDHNGKSRRAVGEYENYANWLVSYASSFYSEPPEHEALRAIAPDVLEYLQSRREALPAKPSQSVVITDLSPENLLSCDGNAPNNATELTGVIDLERAKLGPVEFTAINTEYLLTRFVPEAEPIQNALYAPLPFGPDIEQRDFYRTVAMGRSVGALPFWYDSEGDTYQKRGNAIATELARIVE